MIELVEFFAIFSLPFSCFLRQKMPSLLATPYFVSSHKRRVAMCSDPCLNLYAEPRDAIAFLVVHFSLAPSLSSARTCESHICAANR